MSASMPPETGVPAAADGADLGLPRRIDAIIAVAADLLGAGAAAFLRRGDEPVGASAADAGRAALRHPETLFGAGAGRAVLRSDDLEADPRCGARGLGIRSYLSAPVRSDDGHDLGVLVFTSPEGGRFGAPEERLAQAFAGQVSAVVEIGRLLVQARTELDERRLVEANLRRSQQRFRAAIDAVEGVLWTNSADGRMRGEQPGWAALTGQTFEQYQDFGWAAAVHPDDAEASVDTWNEAVAARTTYVFEHRVRRHDDVYRSFSIRAIPVLKDDGHTIREWVGVHTDITERRQAEARAVAARESAEAANLAKSQFIANMSHELRTPLSAVIGYTGMVAEEIEELGHKGLVEDIHKIEANARHLLGLINDVLDLSKIEAGEMTVSAERFDVAAMIAEVAAAAEPLMAKKRNSLNLDLGKDLGQMVSDEVKIRQCLLNLLGNASKFTTDGTVTLGVRRYVDDGEAWISLEVADTGIGMTPAQLGRLFERFVQADESTTRQFGGTGLGLAITKGFCRKLGGDISVDSSVGQGTTFTIVLPERIPDSERARSSDASLDDGRRGGIVLVVDDDSAARDLLTRFLAREGFRVECAHDGGEGLAMVRRLRPKVVLLDVEMPSVNGWTVLQAIRSDPQVAQTPVVMVSVLHEKSVGLAMGANDYLTKPIDWAEMRRVLEPLRDSRDTCRILVVDDDDGMRGMLASMLMRDGWQVDVAVNGRDALDKVALHPPSLIVLDLMMPGMDGFGFLKDLRARPDGQDAHVVVLTAKDVTRDDRARLEGKVDRVLRKGDLKLDELRAELRRLVPEIVAKVDGAV